MIVGRFVRSFATDRVNADTQGRWRSPLGSFPNFREGYNWSRGLDLRRLSLAHVCFLTPTSVTTPDLVLMVDSDCPEDSSMHLTLYTDDLRFLDYEFQRADGGGLCMNYFPSVPYPALTRCGSISVERVRPAHSFCELQDQ